MKLDTWEIVQLENGQLKNVYYHRHIFSISQRNPSKHWVYLMWIPSYFTVNTLNITLYVCLGVFFKLPSIHVCVSVRVCVCVLATLPSNNLNFHFDYNKVLISFTVNSFSLSLWESVCVSVLFLSCWLLSQHWHH